MLHIDVMKNNSTEKLFRRRFMELEAKCSLGREPLPAIIAMAIQSLEAGFETEMITEVAGESNRVSFCEFVPKWQQLKSELNIPDLLPWQGIHLLVLPEAHELAAQYLQGAKKWHDTAIELVGLSAKWGGLPLIASLDVLVASYCHWQDNGGQDKEFFENLERECRLKIQAIADQPKFIEGADQFFLRKFFEPLHQDY